MLAAVLASCGGGGDNGTAPPPIPPGFSVALSATTLSVEQGASGTINATIGRTGSFAGTVNLLVEGAPTGITAAFAPAAITSATTSTTLSVTVASGVAPGAYSFTVRGQATGLADQTQTVALTVTAKPAIALVLLPTNASVAAGGITTFAATVSRTNFTAAVAVTVSGAPAGVTTTTTTAGDVHAVTVNVGAATAVGTHVLTVTASATGVAPVSATFTLTVTAAPAASIALSAAPAAVTIQAGGPSATTRITIARTNFTGTVVVAVQSGLPVGATAVNAPSGPTAATTVDVAFAASGATTPGTYNVVLQGAGFNATPGTVQVALTVTAASSSSIALAASPPSLTILPGNVGSTFLTITRSNFAGAVQLAASGAPTAVTLTLSPTNTTQNAATLQVAVGSGAALGTFPVTITASGAGITTVQLVVNVTVAPASSGGNVTWRFCGASNELPIWFARQDGHANSPWVQVSPGGGNTYSFDIASQGAVAFVTQNAANNFVLSVSYGTTTELSAQGSSRCQYPTRRTVSGTVTGFGTNNADFVSVALGTAFAIPQPSFALPNFTISGAPDGVRDLVATRSSFDVANAAAGLVLNRVFIKRGLNPPNMGSVGTVDFNGADAFAPETKQLTINGIVAGEQVGASNTFITNTQSFGSMGSANLTTGSTLNIFTVPTARTVAGDVQAISANAAVVSGTLATEQRSVTASFRDPGNPAVTLGARMNAPAVTVVATAPYVRLRSVAAKQNDYLNYWIANFLQVSGVAPRTVTIIMSASHLGGASSFDVTVPDFTGVSGWLNTWGLQGGASTFWNVSMTGWVSGSGGLDDGSIFRTAQRQGVLTP